MFHVLSITFTLMRQRIRLSHPLGFAQQDQLQLRISDGHIPLHAIISKTNQPMTRPGFVAKAVEKAARRNNTKRAASRIKQMTVNGRCQKVILLIKMPRYVTGQCYSYQGATTTNEANAPDPAAQTISKRQATQTKKNQRQPRSPRPGQRTKALVPGYRHIHPQLS